MNSRIHQLAAAAGAMALHLAAAGGASAQDLIAYEGFAYPPSPNLYLANGGTGWGSPWYDINVLPTGVTASSLSWPGLQVAGGSAFTAAYPSTSFTQYSRVIAPYAPLDNTLYISFLVQPNPGYGVTAGLAFGTWTSGMVMGMCPSGRYGLMTPPGTLTSDSAVSAVQGQPALMVARIHNNGDQTVTWALFVNPAVGSTEPSTPDATLNVPGNALPQALMIYNDGGFSTDEIRVGKTWSSVLPSTTPPCPADFTGDAHVGPADLAFLLSHWGGDTAADLTGDGMTGPADLGQLLAAWGACP
jgi:hypothetical protein